MTRVLTLGETMAAFRAQTLRLAGTAELSIAGAESNVAIGLARLGHRVSWLGVTGDDELGELVRRTLRAESVDVGLARVDPAAPTGLAVFERRLAGLVRVNYYRTGSAGSTLGPADVRPAFGPADAAASGGPANGFGLLHVTGITCALGPGPAAAVRTAVELARAAGTPVCLDVNHRARLWSREEAAAVLRPLLPALDILIASDDELPIVAASAGELLDLGVGQVVLTHGAAGATAHTAEGPCRQPARAVVVRDTVGAGDAFVAGYLSGFLDRLPVEDCLHRAVTVAGFAVATDGDWEGLPTRAELPLLDAPPGTAIR
jgi:2-dehydro-3-deoxygluconokinase